MFDWTVTEISQLAYQFAEDWGLLAVISLLITIEIAFFIYNRIFNR